MTYPIAILIGIGLALSLGVSTANAFTTGTMSYGDAVKAGIVDPDKTPAPQQGQQQGTGLTFGGRNSSFGFSPTPRDPSMPSFPGLDNHMSQTDNARALQYGVSPLSPSR